METIRNAGTKLDNLAEELVALRLGRDHAVGEIRTLDDWELALAGGGDNLPEWP